MFGRKRRQKSAMWQHVPGSTVARAAGLAAFSLPAVGAAPGPDGGAPPTEDEVFVYYQVRASPFAQVGVDRALETKNGSH